jgi:TonB family protein
MTPYLLALASAAALAASMAQPDTESPTVLIANDLTGWIAEYKRPPCVRNESGTLMITACAGWVRTERTVFGDYSIAFEARTRSAGTHALLGLLGIDGRNQRPELVLAVPMLGPPGATTQSKMRIEMLSLSASARAQAMKADGEWQSYVVTRNRTGIHVLLNGTEIASSGAVSASDGWIGFRSVAGDFEVRNLRLRHLFPTVTGTKLGGETVDGAYVAGKDVLLPKLLRDRKPSYTGEAMRAQIEGTVLLECVVETDGTIRRATVTRSLDDRFGLDQEAIKAVRAWRFTPGTREGVAVPVWITIELTFSLRK